jgi:hypothetical protein
MASGRLDLFIAKLPINTIVLTLNCSSSDSELQSISRTETITLQRGKIKQVVQLQYLEGRECFADFMEMSFTLARRFQLKALRRYTLTYSSETHILTIAPSPVSEAEATISANGSTPGYLSIGYELLSYLGIPERQGAPIKFRYGKNIANLRLHVPANLSDDRFRLPAAWMQKWKLNANTAYLLQYDQRNSTVSLISPRP